MKDSFLKMWSISRVLLHFEPKEYMKWLILNLDVPQKEMQKMKDKPKIKDILETNVIDKYTLSINNLYNI